MILFLFNEHFVPWTNYILKRFKPHATSKTTCISTAGIAAIDISGHENAIHTLHKEDLIKVYSKQTGGCLGDVNNGV